MLLIMEDLCAPRHALPSVNVNRVGGSLSMNFGSGCDAAGCKRWLTEEFGEVDVTQRGVRGSLGRNLGRGCDAAGREKQFKECF